MVDVDTFLTALYVMVDNFCQSRKPERRPGPEASLSDSEVITLATSFARWGRFSSERDFYRYARRRLRDAFPTLPDRSQFNRLVRSYAGLIEEEVALHTWRSWSRMRDAPPTRGFGYLGHAHSRRQAQGGRGMAGRLRRHRVVQ